MRCLILLLCTLSGVMAGDPLYLDLAPVVNTTLDDDGIPRNGAGGWTDEGINDMGTFPALAPGAQEANGVRFRIVDPATTGGKSVAMLRGARLTTLPASVTVDGQGGKGRFIYFVHHGVARSEGMGKEEVLATYRINYADGSEALAEMRDGRELRHWWTGAWWDNNGPEAWPVLMAQNTYTAKWNKWLGLWATCWSNPSPDKAIKAITLTSSGRVACAVWAITIDDRDYREVIGADYKLSKPATAPAGFFEAKLALERRQIGLAMAGLGLLQGIREAVLIRPDLLAVTIDAAVGGGPGACEAAAAALQQPQAFTLRSAGSEAAPLQVGRHSYLYTTEDIGRFPVNPIYWHTYYLRLAKPLGSGQDCTVRVSGLAGKVTDEIKLHFDPATSITPAIKVNQGAYAATASRRYAYLGWWAGDLGAVAFADCTTFEVVSETDGSLALSGAVTVRAATEDGKTKPVDEIDPLSGESVREIDLSKLGPGRYHLRLPGIGRSWPFAVGGDPAWQLARTAIRGLLTQRCGCDLTPEVTTFPRPGCHVQVYEHGNLVGGLIERWNGGKLIPANPPLRPDEPIRSFHGGYHDAGDFDLFSGHLFGAARLLAAFEAFPKLWKDGDLGLPESGNGIPDLLDEVAWGLKFYADNQSTDGAVPAGRGNDEDYQRNEWLKDGAAEHGTIPPYGVLPPNRSSSATFAAVAGQFARLLAPFDRAQADAMLARVEKRRMAAAPTATPASPMPRCRGSGRCTGARPSCGRAPVPSATTPTSWRTATIRRCGSRPGKTPRRCRTSAGPTPAPPALEAMPRITRNSARR